MTQNDQQGSERLVSSTAFNHGRNGVGKRVGWIA